MRCQHVSNRGCMTKTKDQVRGATTASVIGNTIRVCLLSAAIGTTISNAALAADFPSLENSGIRTASAGPAYWTDARRKAAKERVLLRSSDVSVLSAGT